MTADLATLAARVLLPFVLLVQSHSTEWAEIKCPIDCTHSAPSEITLMHALPDTTQLCAVNNVGSKTCVDVGEFRAWLVRR